jgi:uncharacterized protein (TIGR04255 family)
MSRLHINISEDFPHLAFAPVVEAVIDIRTKSTVALDEASSRIFLEPRLADYTFLDSQQEFSAQVMFGPAAPPMQTAIQAWKGVRFKSRDENSIAQFNKDGFAFSKLAPYQNWDVFSEESMKLWGIYQEMAKAEDVNRLGVRFINRIELPAGDGNFENYINPAPQTPRGLDLPFYGFLYQETLAVPGHPYAINLIRTIQQPGDKDGFSVIIDIDVFTADGTDLDNGRIQKMLNEMCWLKNKIFFGSITEQALETFK